MGGYPGHGRGHVPNKSRTSGALEVQNGPRTSFFRVVLKQYSNDSMRLRTRRVEHVVLGVIGGEAGVLRMDSDGGNAVSLENKGSLSTWFCVVGKPLKREGQRLSIVCQGPPQTIK